MIKVSEPPHWFLGGFIVLNCSGLNIWRKAFLHTTFLATGKCAGFRDIQVHFNFFHVNVTAIPEGNVAE